ncbi:hypothetical protein ACSSZE_18560 [Acidithiobacillus caldus]
MTTVLAYREASTNRSAIESRDIAYDLEDSKFEIPTSDYGDPLLMVWTLRLPFPFAPDSQAVASSGLVIDFIDESSFSFLDDANTAYQEAFEVVDDLAARPWNYSDYEPQKPSEEQVKVAKAGLRMFAEAGFPEPKIMLLNDGTFGAYWRNANSTYVSVDFDAEEKIVLWAIVAEGVNKASHFPLGGTIPPDLWAAFKA